MRHDIPGELSRLPELAYNLWWTWSPEAQELFRRLDPGLWESTDHNPIRLLAQTDRLRAAASDPGFAALYERVMRDFNAYLEGGERPFREDGSRDPVAYFSMEFGLHESLPIYSGGLGVLAGDHLKSASDLGVPLVGVGVLYAQGYFRQRLNAEGRQEEAYESFEPELRPLRPVRNGAGEEIRVSVELPGRELRLKVWEVRVGRVRLLLLDADIPENREEDRRLTARLYGGGERVRLAQELILGVGGVRALRAAGLHPDVYHMNEGHAAFLGLERIRELVAGGRSFEEARELVAESSVFTTHTPVPAGHDRFSPELFWEFMGGWPRALGTDREGLWNLGHREEEWGPTFNMTVLALRLSRARNAVSELHGEVTRGMWGNLFSGNGSAITHITNGVHTWSWLAGELGELFDEYAGPAWRERVEDPAVWEFVREIPAGELWRVHLKLKERMLRFVEERLRAQRERAGLPPLPAFDPEALTLGFARRFATYKRATLILSDTERLKRIVHGPGRPVQFVFAGKAHPADEPGKEFIRALYRASEEEGLAGRFVILEDYDMNIARHLVQGSDVWLNNPRRPLEASGTSGQKAALNGAPNFSVLDGWWREAYDGENGWAIGEERKYASPEEQDAADADSLYRTLEEEIVPLYYRREGSGVPEGWVAVMKRAVKTVAPAFSTQRMVREYAERLYFPRAGTSPGRSRREG